MNNSRNTRARIAVFTLLTLVSAVLYWRLSNDLTLERIADQESFLRNCWTMWPWRVAAVAFLIYVIVTGLSLPGALGLSLAYAWLFGFWTSLFIVSFASTSGATIAFLLSRYLFRDLVRRRLADRAAEFEKCWNREGVYYLLTLRLIPAVPFFAINLAMGLTPIRTRTFWLGSQLGMLPGSILYLYIGSCMPSLGSIVEEGASSIASFRVLAGLVLLALVPWVIRIVINRLGPMRLRR